MTDILVKVVDAYVYRKAEDGLLFLILKWTKISYS